MWGLPPRRERNLVLEDGSKVNGLDRAALQPDKGIVARSPTFSGHDDGSRQRVSLDSVLMQVPRHIQRNFIVPEALAQLALVLPRTPLEREVAKDDARLLVSECGVQQGIVD